MQQYYRVGRLDDCTKKFSDLFDCLSLKTKSASEAEVCSFFFLTVVPSSFVLSTQEDLTLASSIVYHID